MAISTFHFEPIFVEKVVKNVEYVVHLFHTLEN